MRSVTRERISDRLTAETFEAAQEAYQEWTGRFPDWQPTEVHYFPVQDSLFDGKQTSWAIAIEAVRTSVPE